MAIVSSEIVEQYRQTDNRWDITERHIDHLAKQYLINYLSEPGTATPVTASVVVGTDSEKYVCIQNHTASADNQPVTGVNWQNFWMPDEMATGEVAWQSGANYVAEDVTYAPPANINALLTQHAVDIWNNCVYGEEMMYLGQLVNGNLPDPALIPINYSTRINILKRFIRWMAKNNCVECLKAVHVYLYIKDNYTSAQIATALGVSVDNVNAFMQRFFIINRDLKPLIEADETEVVDWGD